MMITSWKPLRISLLALTCGSVLLVLGKVILYPTRDRVVTPFTFVDAVPLPEWQISTSEDLLTTKNDANFIAGKRYQYLQNKLKLEVEMRYLVKTNGDVEEYMKKYNNIDIKSSPDKLTSVNKEGAGSYGLLVYQGRAHLSACINPRGGSTVTFFEFLQNRNAYDVNFNRVLPWLLGFQELRDRRCLWSLMSMPVETTSKEDAYKTLETAWVSWYQWWQPRFPKP